MSRLKNKFLKKFEVESYILNLFNLNQIIVITFLILLPLILSVITFLISNYKPSFLTYLPIKNYFFYIAFWLYTYVTFFVVYLISRLILLHIKNKNSNILDWSVLKTLALLWKNRGDKNINFFHSIFFSILFFYSYFFYWIYSSYQYQEFYSDFSSIIIIVVLTIFFSASIGRYYWSVMGFQEGIIRYLPYMIIFGTTLFFILIITLGSPDLKLISKDPAKIILLFEVLFLPIMATIVGVWISKTFSKSKSIFARERKMEEFGWNKIFYRSFNILFFSWLLFSFFFTYSIIKIAFLIFYMFENYMSYYLILITIVLNLFFIVIALIMIHFIVGEYILRGLYDWSCFFDVYYGKKCYQLDKTRDLIKTQGTVIGIKSKKTIEDPEVDYQFSISYGKNKIIEIVKLKENVPFINSKNIVKEGDKVLIIGKIKRIYNEYPNANYHNVIFAYHVE